jgi:DNA repair protein SbcC/Rad50
MRPHRLEVTAFGAFAGTATVSFDDLEGLFLLHGETGAGKTTLLDAIAFALYGQVPGARGKAKRLRSDHAAPGVTTEVELEVTIGGRRLRITRKPEQERPKKSGTGTVREQASVRLAELSPDGDWETKSTRVGEADAEIGDLMGMSAEQFFQVVLLPQGEFAKFLHAEAKHKEALLRKLFGTDRFGMVEDWLADRRRVTDKEVAAAEEVVSRLVAQVAQAAGVQDPDQGSSAPWQATWAASLAAAADAAREAAAARVARCQNDLDDALAAKAQAEHLADRQRRRRDALRRRTELQAAVPEIAELRTEAETAAQAAEVAAVLDAADRAVTAAQSARQAEAQARAALPAASGWPEADPATLRGSGQEQQKRLGKLDALRAVAQQAAGEDKTATSARTRAASLAADLEQAEADAARRRAARPRAEQARDAASRAAAALPAAQAAADAARQVAADAATLVSERAERDRAHEAHVSARELAVLRREEAHDVRVARIDGMRAELAAAMTDGSPCPVCGSLDHPDPVEPTFAPVSQEQEEAARARADKATAEADEMGKVVAAHDARIGELAKRLGETAATALLADPVTLADAARRADDHKARLDAEAASRRQEAAALEDRQRVLDDLDELIAGDKAALAELSEQRTAALAEAEAAAGRAADRRAELRAQLGGAPDLDAAITAARDLGKALAGAADAAEETARTAADARDAAGRADRAATQAGFASPKAARAAFRDTSWRRRAADRLTAHEAETQMVASLLADPDLDVAIDAPAPVAGKTQAAEAARHLYDAATGGYATAARTAEDLAVLKPRLDDALATLRPLAERAAQIRQLADLAAGLGANQYKMTLSSFVLAARLEEVALAASERLLTMTAGRYSLIHSDARKGNSKAGLSLLACDSWTGVDRDTATLSGGETFLASLSLALGLADVVTAEAAGAPMEALFVDEGFGTLDEDTLDEVMNILDGLREGGRIVGIVSHVAELRQRIPAQVYVRKTHHGSQVTVRAG